MASSFLLERMDFIFFFYGMAFILLAATCAAMSKDVFRRLPWMWLGLFALIHGINEWLDMLAINLGDGPAFVVCRLIIMTVSFVCLLVFGGNGLRRLGGKGFGLWVYPLLLVCAASGGFSGFAGLNAAVRYAFGLTGGLCAAALFKAARIETESRGILSFIASVMAVYALAAGAIVPKAAFSPATLINHEAFLTLTGIPVQLLRGICALLIAASVWAYYQKTRQLALPAGEGRSRASFGFHPILATFIILSAGGIMADYFGRVADREVRNEILIQAKTAAAAINPERVRNLTVAAHRDLRHADYQRLSEQLQDIKSANPRLCWLHLMLLVDGKIFHVIPRDAQIHHDYPGEVYDRPPKALYAVFATGEAVTVGPYAEESRSFISAFAAIRDTQTSPVLGVLAFDVDAAVWKALIGEYRLAAIALTLPMALLITGFFVVRQRLSESAQFAAASEKRLAEAQEIAHIGSWTFDPETKRVTWSKEMLRIFGFDPEDEAPSYPDGFYARIHPEDRISFEKALHRSLESATRCQSELRLLRPDGSVRNVLTKTDIKQRGKGETCHLMGTIEDITERKQAEEALRQSEQRLRLHVELIPLAVIEWDVESRVMRWNPGAEKIFGYTAAEAIGCYGSFILAPKVKTQSDRVWCELISQRDCQRGVTENITKDGRRILCDWYNTPLTTLDGKIIGVASLADDITERRRMEEELKQNEERYRLVASAAHDWVYWQMPDGGFRFISPSCFEITGYSPEEYMCDPELLSRVVHPDDVHEYRQHMEYVTEHREESAIDFRIIHRNGQTRWIAHACRPMYGELGEFLGRSIANRDITERKLNEEKFRELSLVDELTGLSNRRGFMTLAAQQIKIAERLGQTAALIYADLDKMKWINDTLGHQEGDQALKDTANLLVHSFRASDVIARLGGDEFVGFVLESSQQTGEEILERLQENLRAHNRQENRFYELSISIGLSRYDPQSPCELEELIESGDQAMYEQKKKRGQARI